MRGHVFIVNEETLPIHLSYNFVGMSTGGRDFNIALLADISRVKEGDFVFFYIEGSTKKKGRFFGIYKAVDNIVYHVQGANAYDPGLPLKLIFRKHIQPYKVFSEGIIEWIALDKLPTYSRELLWTLIYRKMKGFRGNTMLFPWEVERLISMITAENQGNHLSFDHFTFDAQNYNILQGTTSNTHNFGTPVTVSLQDLSKSETHFQAYIVQNLSLNNNTFFPHIFGTNLTWIGNEVFAGTGMQKIDIITIEQLDQTSNLYRLIELKHPKSSTNINYAPQQLDYYINWARDDIGGHMIGTQHFNVKPIVLSLTNIFNSVPSNIINEVRALSTISKDPEIWEMDFSLNLNQVL